MSESDRERRWLRTGANADLPIILGKNLRRVRTRRGYSLERLADLSGVSRAMIGQVELARSSPTVSVLWKLATALGVELEQLLTRQVARPVTVLRREEAHVATLSDGKFASRSLVGREHEGHVEFYELIIAPRHREEFKAELKGCRENLLIANGALTVVIGAGPSLELERGDAISFEADVARRFVNRGSNEAVFYLVRSFSGPRPELSASPDDASGSLQ